SFTIIESVMILCMVVLGGMGHIPGVILGAVLLVALPEALRYLGPLQQALAGRVLVDPADLRLLLFGLALILVMLLRPSGLWPSRIRRRELSGKEQEEPAQQAEAYDVPR
ncbi:MAG: ABC transporter ATP-binding protein, partial [Betaproteobacteria bacterium]|nr:ABC transporter ATP-binding protein [Betaproteobacteria bacterium]